MRLWYFYHSGVAVRTRHHLLVFDYWKNASLPGGILALAKQENCPVLVFVSHAHDDHFNPEIFSWQRELDVTYLLSDDLPPRPDCTMLGPGARLKTPRYTVQTLPSTDEGVAFLVEIDGVVLYHAGDLHWWHWSGEPDSFNLPMARDYKAALEALDGKQIDTAFVPVDGRLDDAFSWGIDYFAAHVDCAHLVPIHFSSDETVLQRLTARHPAYEQRLVILDAAHPTAELPEPLRHGR